MDEMKYPKDFPDRVLYNKMRLSGQLLVSEIAEGIRDHYPHLTDEKRWRIAVNVVGSMINSNDDGTYTIEFPYYTFVKEGIKKATDPKSNLEKLLLEPILNKGDHSEQGIRSTDRGIKEYLEGIKDKIPPGQASPL